MRTRPHIHWGARKSNCVIDGGVYKNHNQFSLRFSLYKNFNQCYDSAANHYRTVMWQTFEVFCSVSQSIGNWVLGSVMYPQDIWSYLCNIYPGCMELIYKDKTLTRWWWHEVHDFRKYLIPNILRLNAKDNPIERWWWYEVHYFIKYLIPNTCCWMQRSDHIKVTIIRSTWLHKIPNT